MLVLFGEDPRHGPDVLLMERASTLRNHAGQVAFPGGGADPGDPDAVGTALREAEEETGVEPSGVVPLALLPELFVPPSGFVVTPVIAHWAAAGRRARGRPRRDRRRGAGAAGRARRPRQPAAGCAIPSGFTGPAFTVAGLLVWGFTGGLLSALLDRGGWARSWDTTRVDGPGRSVVDGAGRSAGGRRIMSAGPEGSGRSG